MDWDRRTFVKFVVGGVLGMGASPLAYKFMDDTAIWTQNWNWVPVPEDGARAFAKTLNPSTSTGLTVNLINGRVKGERAIRLVGDPDNPVTGGGVVPADTTALQLLYNDEIRLAAPLVRDRATGMHHQVSWDEALALWSAKLNELTQAGKPQELVILGDDADSTTAQILSRFAAAFGTPNLAFSPSAKTTLALAGKFTTGQEELGFDLAHADYVVSLGAPLLEGFGAPVADRAVFQAWRANKAYLVQFESRCSITASQADLWLASKPGAEGAVALALAAIMLQKGLAKGQGAGLEEFRSYLQANFPVAKLEAITGVSPENLTKIAEEFAKAKAGVAVIGPGPSREPGRLYDFMAVLALNALKGNLGQPGGLVVRQAAALKPLGADLPAPTAVSLDGREKSPLGLANIHKLAKAALEGEPYKAQVLILAGGNHVFYGPQANVMHRLARKTPFVVAITPYLDESAAVADLCLPATHFLEGWGDAGTPYGLPVGFHGVHKPLINVHPEAKPVGEAFLALAAKLGGKPAEALPFENMEAALTARVADLGGLESLAEKTFWAQEKPAYGSLSFEFNSAALAAKLGGGEKGLPLWEAPEAYQTNKAYPFLMEAIPSLRTSAGREPITPYMVKILSDTTLAHTNNLVVEINPETAHELHLYEGDMVKVESEAGGLRAEVHLYHGATPGVVYVPVGLGHTAFGMYLNGKGDNFNRAVEVATDPASGQPDWRLTRVNLKKLVG
ncbi:MAG: molybdopterin-dependent oxidoreductase [Deltaproteobacteria bacterium]|nr:molybdopterin-dependent oxidoreductase [Deltaproteobacteria bacterium]